MPPFSSDSFLDVKELCALLQCLGFSVKYLYTTEENFKKEGRYTTVFIKSQPSGLDVILENLSRSCPSDLNQQHGGICQVYDMTCGKQTIKECGSAILATLPESRRERLAKDFQDIARCIKGPNESDVHKNLEPLANKSASMLDLKTPEKRLQLKSDTPRRYRSLDALTAKDDQLPAPGPLAKDDDKKFVLQRQGTYVLSSTPETSRILNEIPSPIQLPPPSILDNLVAAEKIEEDLRNKLSNVIQNYIEEGKDDSSLNSLALDVPKLSVLKCRTVQHTGGIVPLQFVFQRQGTYILSPTPETSRIQNETPSPIQLPPPSILDNLVAAEKVAEDLRNELSNVIENYVEEGKDDSSLIFLALDVPKISVLKDGSKIKFASSPDLSGVGVQENYIKRFKPLKSASTSSSASITTAKEGEISSNLSKLKNPPTILNSKNKSQDNKGSKLNHIINTDVINDCNNGAGNHGQQQANNKPRQFCNTKTNLKKGMI